MQLNSQAGKSVWVWLCACVCVTEVKSKTVSGLIIVTCIRRRRDLDAKYNPQP